jgi:drug/metabolite transporter (DMT)-like permease
VTVVLALLSALAYGVSDFVGGLTTRRIDVWTTAAFAQMVSLLVVVIPAVLSDGSPAGTDLAWGAVAGVGSAAGTMFLYRGLARGRMSVVAPISAVGSAVVPVVVAVLTGERPAALAWVGVGCALPAIWLVSQAERDLDASATSTRASVVDGLLAGAGFGLLFVALGQVPEEAGLLPVVAMQAASSTLLVVAAYGIGNGLRWRRDAVAGPAAAGVLAAAATVLFQLATQSGLLTVASVLTALYPAMTVLLAAAVLKERIARRQAGGLALAVVAVALVAAG